MKDRLSIHIDNGQSEVFEAVTVLRNGGTVLQSGLVGITNITHDTATPPITPSTILNIQTSEDASIRSTARSAGAKSKIELLSGSNTPSSGVSISFTKLSENSGVFDVSKFDDYGNETSFIVHQSGTLAVGTIRTNTQGVVNDASVIDGNSVLLVSNTGSPSNSGTIAIRSQTQKASPLSNFGKTYVKPYEFNTQVGQTDNQQFHALYFIDGYGNEYNATPNICDSTAGIVYGGDVGSTFAGWYTPTNRTSWNFINSFADSFFGHGIDVRLNLGTTRFNSIFGYQAGSGTSRPVSNTVFGASSFNHLEASTGNIILGFNSLTRSIKEEYTPSIVETVNNTILIGNNLFVDEFPDDYSFALGHDAPLVTGLLRGSNRKFALRASDTEDTRLTIEKDVYDFNFGLEYEDGRFLGTFGSQDKSSTAQARSKLSMRFKNANGHSQTLVDYDPSGVSPNNSPTWSYPTFKTPTVSISGDLRVLGAIRFSDGTDLSDVASFKTNFGSATSGIKRFTVNGDYYFGLNYNYVPLISSLANPLNTSQAYLAVDAPQGLGKISISALSAYVSSGTARFGDNCNAMFTNVDNVSFINQTKNYSSVFIGCDVAASATGWKNSVFIGTEAGKGSTIPNGSLATDTACLFLGYRSGYESANTRDAIFIGNSAGKNADGSQKSIFIGQNAGENSTNPNSIGIGAHALGGTIAGNEGGSKNIEIVAGLDDNQRLLYGSGNLSNRINIQNTIAGNTESRQLSIGHVTLSPESPLDVVRSTVDFGTHAGHTGANIQKWNNQSSWTSFQVSGVARVDESGSFIKRTIGNNYSGETGACDSWFGTHEGFMDDYIYAPTSYTSPTSGWMTTRTYENGFGTDRKILVVNRDNRLNIHGPGATGGTAFVVTMMVNGEHRPIFVSCSGI